MATLYKRIASGASSPYWWIKWVDETGKIRQESTNRRWDSVQETREARKIRAQKEILEHGSQRVKRTGRALEDWVQPWLDSMHKNDDGTLECYTGSWKNLLRFLKMKGVKTASDVTRDHCHQYIEWRTSLEDKNARKKKRGKKVCRNTALNDLRILRKVMYEAYNREWIDRNPVAKLGIKRDPPPQKPVISDHERALVEATFPEVPDWREISWTIAINQGCRLKETSLPLSRVDFDNDLITFELKGGKLHTTKLMPAVKTLLLRLREMGCTRTWAFHRLASRDWSRIFHGLGLKFSFHSTRVTVITKLARGGVNEQQARRFIGHASSEIHAIYTRLEADDLDSCVKALESPGAPPPTGPSALPSTKPGTDMPPSGGIPRKKIGRPTKPRRA